MLCAESLRSVGVPDVFLANREAYRFKALVADSRPLVMELADAGRRLEGDERKGLILGQMTQPLTATQLSARTRIPRDDVSRVLFRLMRMQLTRCVNHKARQSRLYWPTRHGIKARDRARKACDLSPAIKTLPQVDWDVYGAVCYRHRSAVLKALDEPLQAAAIKRVARRQNEHIRMSANNVRDVMRLLLMWGLVVRVQVRRYVHKRYALTPDGQSVRSLLRAAEVAQ